jgi:outer membrane protein OmpA-like peptidoglycan-associated protein
MKSGVGEVVPDPPRIKVARETPQAKAAPDPSRADAGGTDSAIAVLIAARQQAERVQSRPRAIVADMASRNTAQPALRLQPGNTAKGAATVSREAGHSSRVAREVANPKLFFMLKRIQFDYGTAAINLTSSENELFDEVASFLRAHPEILELEVQGHTDDLGSRVLNEHISKKRADAVKRALVARGISGDRLLTKGYGPDRPIADNATDEGRRRNRRVEFSIVKKKMPQ